MPFFEYNQNNTGGRFTRNANIRARVIIEADSASAADQKAEGIGIYFNGCEDGFDCPCCGDRWYPVYGEGKDVPSVYDTEVTEFIDGDIDDTSNGSEIHESADVVVYYADGTRRYAEVPKWNW